MSCLVRIAIRAGAVLSLLIFVATIMLWVRSYRVQDWFDWQKTDGPGLKWAGYTFASNHGSLYVSMSSHTFSRGADAGEYAASIATPEGFSYHRYPSRPEDLPKDTLWQRLGFSIVLKDDAQDLYGTFSFPRAFVPHWFVAMLTAILPVFVFVRAFRKRHGKPGVCSRCGYDLRATPERCPECGAACEGAV